MSSFREIVTKAIIGKCKKVITANYNVECEETPNTVLGCWVINHKFNGIGNNEKVTINGSYDVNVWYSYANDTKTAVCSKTFTYNDNINVSLKNNAKLNNNEVIVECLKQPTVVDVGINGGTVEIKCEKEMGVEIIGNMTVKIAVEDDYDDYEEVFDSEKDEELNINIDKLDDNFIKDDVNEK